MSNAKHTPGPWLAKHRQGADEMYRTEVYSEQHGGIATCDWTPKNCGNGVTSTYREANARLIASAPELLEALQKMLDVWEHGGIATYPIGEARAAISKATGGQQ